MLQNDTSKLIPVCPEKNPDPWNKHNNTRCCYIFAMSIFIHTSIYYLKFVVSESLSLETVIYMYKQCD